MLMSSVPVLGEPWDMLGESAEGKGIGPTLPLSLPSTGSTLEDAVVDDIRSPRDLPACATGETLGLPMNFG